MFGTKIYNLKMIIYQSRQVAETNNLTITSGMATNEGDKKTAIDKLEKLGPKFKDVSCAAKPL